MKIRFEGLNKSRFVNALYESKRESFEERGIFLPELSKNDLCNIETHKGIKSIHGVDLNISFDSQYVYFGLNDDLFLILNILLMMKEETGLLYKNVKDDLVLEHEYKFYKNELMKYELEIDKMEKELFNVELLLIRYKRIKEINNKPFKATDEIFAISKKGYLKKQLDKLIHLRLMSLMNLLELEGNHIYTIKESPRRRVK